MNKLNRYVMLGLAVAAMAGCDSGNATMPDMTVFGPVSANTASVNGFVWDPEAFWWTWALCGGQQCPIPPIRVDGVPTIERSVVNGATVMIIDPTIMSQMPVLTDPNTHMPLMSMTDQRGTWFFTDIPVRSNPPFFSLSLPPAMGGTPLNNDYWPMGLPKPPDVPPGNYFPTVALKPIYTTTGLCIGQPGALISDAGILQAVAKFLSATTSSTVVASDFVDPTKYGGVAVWWMYLPAPPVARVPAFGAKMTADMGTTYNIDWAPPGAMGLPQQVVAIQSDRGFFVNPMAPSSPMGITVTLLPPASGPTNVKFTASDPVTDSSQGRPWTFPPLPDEIPIAPTLVSFGELPGHQPDDTAPPPIWVCLQ